MAVKRQRRVGISLIERALIEKQWHETAVSAQIHALMGDSGHQMVDKAGRMLYVVLGAVIADDVDPGIPEVRILRGACNAVYDQAGEEAVPGARRASILAGLEAAARLIPALERKSLVDAACELRARMRTGDVLWSDFQNLLGKVAA